MGYINIILISFAILYMLASTAMSQTFPKDWPMNPAPPEPLGLDGNWPQADVGPPPTPNFTKLIDLSKVANAPVNPSPVACGTNLPNDPFCNWSCTGCTRATDVVKCPNDLDWGLSFDDGPTVFTNTLLDYLESQNVRVTFFVIGSRVIQNPSILQKAFKAGHQIGVHTWSHPLLTSQSNEQIIAELSWTKLAIQTAINVTPIYMRPPFGDYDDRVRGICQQLNLTPTIWDLDTNDWMSQAYKNFQLDSIPNNFSEWVSDPNLMNKGHISLQHDLFNQTVNLVPLVVPIIKKANYNIKPISTCIGDNKPYLENIVLESSNSINYPNIQNDNTNNSTSNKSSSPNASNSTKLFI
ncbi:416_t:CDS:2, partial [Scutellospora calospora]